MSDSEYEFNIEEYNENENESDNESNAESDIIVDSDIILNNIEDSNVFRKQYPNLLKKNITSIYLNKYEITKILSKRCEQLENGSQPLISNFEIYNNVYDIALKELNDKKIPFILKRLIDNNNYEYFKLEDLNF